MRTQQRRAGEIRIGDTVVCADGRLLTVTSMRLQGLGPGVVSVGFAELGHRVSYRAADAVLVVRS